MQKFMTHTYHITGMTCTGCRQTVQNVLSGVEGVRKVDVDLANGKAEIETESLLSTGVLQSAFKNYPKYKLSAASGVQTPASTGIDVPAPKSWIEVYKPILLIFGYVALVSLISGNSAVHFDPMIAMRVFMAGFFLVFSFFKMLDLNGFVDSYAMYDLVAKQFRGWGYLYAFIELALGVSYALNIEPVMTNIATLAVMSISIVGVLQSVIAKRKIRCACLGAVFNLPMSTVTIVEDALMIVMSGIMLFLLD
jgi:copper chaperone CopZ